MRLSHSSCYNFVIIRSKCLTYEMSTLHQGTNHYLTSAPHACINSKHKQIFLSLHRLSFRVFDTSTTNSRLFRWISRPKWASRHAFPISSEAKSRKRSLTPLSTPLFTSLFVQKVKCRPTKRPKSLVSRIVNSVTLFTDVHLIESDQLFFFSHSHSH